MFSLLYVFRAFNQRLVRQSMACARFHLDNLHGRHLNSILPADFTEKVALQNLLRSRCPTYNPSLFLGWTSFSRHFVQSMIVPNCSNLQTRAAHTGNRKSNIWRKCDNCVRSSLPNVNKLSDTKKNINCSKSKSFNSEKLKICRPRLVSSSACNMNSDLKLRKIRKLLNDENFRAAISGKNKSTPVKRTGAKDEHNNLTGELKTKSVCTKRFTTKDNNSNNDLEIVSEKKSARQITPSSRMQSKQTEGESVHKALSAENISRSVTGTANEILKWISTVQKYIASIEKSGNVGKSAIQAKSKGAQSVKPPMQKTSMKVGVSPKFFNPHLTKSKNTAEKMKEFKNNSECSVSSKLHCKNVSRIASDLYKINKNISQLNPGINVTEGVIKLSPTKVSGKSKKTKQLLEVRPTFIQNISHEKQNAPKGTDFIKKPNNLQSRPTVSTEQKWTAEKSGKNVNDARGFILVDSVENHIKIKKSPQNLGTKNIEKGFVLLNTESVVGKASLNNNVSRLGKVNPVVAKDAKITVNNIQQKNAGSTRDSAAEIIKSEVSTRKGEANDVISNVVKPDKVSAMKKEKLVALLKATEKSEFKQTNNNQTQFIGRSDSRIEVSKGGSIRRDFPLKENPRININATNRSTSPYGNIINESKHTLQDRLLKNATSRSETFLVRQNNKLYAKTNDYIKEKTSGNSFAAKNPINKSNVEHQLQSQVKQKTETEATLNSSKVSNVTRSPHGGYNTNKQKSISSTDVTQRLINAKKTDKTSQSNTTLLDVGNSQIRGQANKSKVGECKGQSSSVKVAELKPDVRQNKKGKKSQNGGQDVAKSKSEPLLCVRPEELSKTLKQTGRPITAKISPPVQFRKKAQSDLFSLGLKSGLGKPTFSNKVDSAPRYKVQQKAYLDAGLSESNKIILIGLDGLPIATKDPSQLSRQSQQKSTSVTKIPTKSASVCGNKEECKRNAKKSRIINGVKTTQQRPNSVNENCNKFYEGRLNGPDMESNTNCLVTKHQDRGFSSDKAQKENKSNPTPKGATVQKSSSPISPPASPRRNERLPTMGMSQRFMLASKTPPDARETGHPPNTSIWNESSMTDMQSTRDMTDIDELPDVGQFEEWLQNNMPDVYGDADSKSPHSFNKRQPSQYKMPDGLKEQNNDDQVQLEGSSHSLVKQELSQHKMKGDLKAQNSSEHLIRTVGSSVDGPQGMWLSNKYSNPNINMDMDADSKRRNSADNRGVQSANEKRTKRDVCIGTSMFKKDKHRTRDANVASPVASKESLSDANRLRKSRSGHHERSEKAAPSTARDVDLSVYSNKQEGEHILNKSQEKYTLSSPVKSSKMPNLLHSILDGIISMTVVPEEPPTKFLKPTLKRSRSISRDRSSERRVSFENLSHSNDTNGRLSGEQVGSSMYGQSPREAFVSSRETEETNLREFLANERKQAVTEARQKLIQQHADRIREYETALTKYRTIIGKIENVVGGKTTKQEAYKTSKI